jgi:hypothetical protein
LCTFISSPRFSFVYPYLSPSFLSYSSFHYTVAFPSLTRSSSSPLR